MHAILEHRAVSILAGRQGSRKKSVKKRPLFGFEVFLLSVSAPVKSSAARAALDLTGAANLPAGT
ncbi:hypothetical protein ACIPW4_11570 [Pseudomonas sp. NPDC089996]|uniref:hypothetical protein n=1 Tax=Pseudomonas sp. NPDC089996 TaxID=3364474 RepID=UPI00381AB456